MDAHHATHIVTVLGHGVDTATLHAITSAITRANATVNNIRRTADYPLTCLQITVTAPPPAHGAHHALRCELTAITATEHVDVAVTPAGHAPNLAMFDVDSTLIQGEVIDMLAAEAGTETHVRAITEAAMCGEIDFTQSLRRRVATLEGLNAAVLTEVADRIELTPGARTTIRTLRRLGYHCGVVTGGFTQVIHTLTRELHFDYVRANTLDIVEGKLTGRLTGAIVDRPAKAAALREFANQKNVPMHHTVAVGDGANDIDMITAAGLGIAFNAKPPLREVADATLTHPYLDTVLFVMGLTRADVDTNPRAS